MAEVAAELEKLGLKTARLTYLASSAFLEIVFTSGVRDILNATPASQI